eukprot:4949020-Alexandrium_andersonii.AAC.1
MSASLVGSEMCIRDRLRYRATPVQRRHTAMSSGPNAGERCGSSLSASVSYTHLTLPTICSV